MVRAERHSGLTEYLTQKQLALLLTLTFAAVILAVTNQSILFRAPWGDESALLRNIKIIGTGNALHQLPLFDQASPIGATLLLKAIAELTNFNYPVMRLILLMANFAAMFSVTRIAGLRQSAIPFVLFWLSPSLVQYSTELKQYSFEIFASYIVLATIVAPRFRWFPAVNLAALLLSFGALIQVAAQCLMRSCDLLKQTAMQRRPVFIGLVASGLMLTCFYAIGKQLTSLQFSNYHDNAFKNAGFLIDMARLAKFFFVAHGPLLLASALVVSALALRAFGWREILADPLVTFLLLNVGMIVALRALGFYPVAATRHIIWIVPVTIFVVATWLDRLLAHSPHSWNAPALAAALALGMTSISRVPMEVASDKELFAELTKLPPASAVVLNLGAQVALPLYTSDKQSGLNKYRFLGWVEPSSAPIISESAAMKHFDANVRRPGVFASWTYFEKNHDYRPLWRYLVGASPISTFYLVNSHQTPLGSTELDGNAGAMVAILNEHGCAYRSAYTGHYAEIIRVQCPG
jgi:hypothetical protein